MAKRHRPPEAVNPASATTQLPEVELPEMSGFGIHPDALKWNAVRVTNYGVVEVLSPRPESKHAATARAFEAFKLHIASSRRSV